MASEDDRREDSAAQVREPTTREIADALLTYNECLAWAEQFQATPFNMLALATVAAKAAGPVLVMRSLFALAAERAELARDKEVLVGLLTDEQLSEYRRTHDASG